MKTIKVALLTTVLLVAPTSFALTTLGDPSCGQWASRTDNAVTKLAVESWLMGTMTGLAYGMNTDILAPTDGASIILWMDNYCRAHPLDMVISGALALAPELSSRMPKQ